MISFTTDLDPRIIIRKNRVYRIQNYDLDNAYPQNIDMLISASGAATRCVNTFAKFIKGEGFKDLTFYKAIINRRGMTVDMLFRKLAADYARFKGYGIHMNFNLNGKITEVFHVPFEHIRLGDDEVPEVAGRAALYDDWDGRRRLYFLRKKIDWIDLYNADPEYVSYRIEEEGVGQYKGQLFYYGNEYPLSPIDSVREDVITDSETKMYKFRNVTTNFMASHMFATPEFEKEEERTEFRNNVKKFQGGKNASRIFHVEYKKKDQIPEIKPFDVPKNDRMFEYHETSVGENIRKQFGAPGVLIGETIPGQIGLSQQMVDAITYYNNYTKEERIMFEETFKDIFSNWEGAINPSGNYSIIPMGTGEFMSESLNPKKEDPKTPPVE
ncbi:MAG TPA: hypothetical protein VJY62_02420 [Bacteroidia bacterium]|nr:hypothetical protein [Bacteroidia bacterium]